MIYTWVWLANTKACAALSRETIERRSGLLFFRGNVSIKLVVSSGALEWP
jgi:hypothetical protein